MNDAVVGGRFLVRERAGEGAFSIVDRAEERGSGRSVALKRLRSADPNAAERLRREARLLAELEHPHLVRHVAHGEDEGQPWLALEWLDGEDLASRQQRAPLRPAEALRAARQALGALAALHDAGVVHRDVKPGNFVVHGEGDALRLTLLDLGVARSFDEDEGQDLVRVGTPAYMAPEQAAGDLRSGPGADVYAVAVWLFEALTGERPHGDEEDEVALLTRIVAEPPRQLLALRPELPEALGALLDAALRKSPNARPSARRLADGLAELDLGELPAPELKDRASHPTSEERPSNRPLRRARVITALFVEGAPAGEVDALAGAHGGEPTPSVPPALVFGARRSRGDESLRAARAALALRERMPDARVALVRGRSWTDEKLEGLRDRAPAMLARATDGPRVDPATARPLGARFVLEADPAEAGEHVLRAERTHATAAEPRLLGKETPFVDRERELARLLDEVEGVSEARRASASVVLGEAGIGKSRLRFELLQHLEASHVPPRVLFLRGDPMLAGVPLGALAQALRLRVGFTPEQDDAARRAAFDGFVRAHGVEAHAEALGELVGVGGEASALLRSLRSDAAGMAAALRDAALAVLSRWVEDRPLLVVVDDLQWLDGRTVDVLGVALERLPFALVAFGRPSARERFPAIWDARRPARFELKPLGDEAATRLVRHVMDEAPDALVASIVERAQGNPLFIEELVRAAAQGDAAELPLAIHAAFQVRIDALPAPARRTLLAASVAGRVLWSDALSALLADERVDVEQSLEALLQSETLLERPRSRFAGTRELVFRHALLRDAAYAMLPDEERAALHGALAGWLKARGRADAAELAHHLEEAGDTHGATLAYMRASARSLREGAAGLAREQAERGLRWAEGPARAALAEIAAGACHRLGLYEEGLAHSSEGLAARPAPDVTLRLAADRALTLRRLGRLEEAEAAIAAGLEQARGASAAARAVLRVERAWTHYNAGRPEPALQDARAVLASTPDAPELASVRLGARHAEARALHDLGRLEEALEAHREVVESATELGHRWRGEGARHGLGLVLLALGRDEEAARELERARANGRELGLPSTAGYAALFLGFVHARADRWEACAEAAREAAALGEELGAAPLLAGARVLLGVVAALGPRDPEALLAALEETDDDAAPLSWRRAARALELRERGALAEREAEALRAAIARAPGDLREADALALRLLER